MLSLFFPSRYLFKTMILYCAVWRQHFFALKFKVFITRRKIKLSGSSEKEEILMEDSKRAFDETKLGVKGLVDEGITKIPCIFHHLVIISKGSQNQGIKITLFLLLTLEGSMKMVVNEKGWLREWKKHHRHGISFRLWIMASQWTLWKRC